MDNGQGPVEIVFEAPGREAPGFLRRQYLALSFQDAFKNGQATAQTIRDMVEFLLAYIKEPVDRQQAENLLWEASEAQFMTMLEAITGQTDDQQAGLKKSDKSPGAG